MYIYIFKDGSVYKHQSFSSDIEFIECLFIGVGTVKEFAGGEWLEVPDYEV